MKSEKFINKKLRLISGELTKAHPSDAGWDIRSNEYKEIPAGCDVIISTGLRVKLPEGHVGLVSPRSGLSFKNGIETGAGIVDEGFTGEIKVHLYNFSNQDFTVTEGNRIAQLVVLPVYTNGLIEVESGDIPTDRGDRGFGSSGIE